MKKSFLFLSPVMLLWAQQTPNVAVLDPIVITATQTPTPSSRVTSKVEVITSEEIETKGYRSLAEAIASLPGVSFSQNGGFGKVTSLYIRGLGTEKILVLLDGIPLNNPSSTDGQAFLEHINLDTIDRIELIKGGNSATWGSDAAGAVINLITKSATQTGFSQTVGLEYGSFNTKKLNTTLGYKNRSFDVLLSASKLRTDGFSARAPRLAEADGYDNTTYLLKLGYALTQEHRLSFTYNHIESETQYDGLFSPLGADDPVANASLTQKDYTLLYTFENGPFSSRLKLSRSDSKRTDFSDSAFGDALVKHDAKIKLLSWIGGYRDDTKTLLLGAEKRQTQGVYTFNAFAPTQNTFDDKAVFLNGSYNFGKTLFEVALRNDFFESFDNAFSYKIGFKHRNDMLKDMQIRANLYRSTDAPNAYQLANALANTTLRPDTTEGFDISLEYKNFSLTYFSNTVTDKLSYDLNNFGYINAQGKEKANGMELSGRYFFDTLSLATTLNYTRLFAYKDSSGNLLAKRPKQSANVTFEHYSDYGAVYVLEGNYVGERIERETNTGNYLLWNISYHIDLPKDFRFSIYAKNIFDKEYQTTLDYAEAGRSFFFKLSNAF